MHAYIGIVYSIDINENSGDFTQRHPRAPFALDPLGDATITGNNSIYRYIAKEVKACLVFKGNPSSVNCLTSLLSIFNYNIIIKFLAINI